MKHPHAELMLQYAQDAMTTDKPWELWEFRNTNIWRNCTVSLVWNARFEYRRKPQTVTKWLWADKNGEVLYAKFLSEKEVDTVRFSKLEWSATEFPDETSLKMER